MRDDEVLFGAPKPKTLATRAPRTPAPRKAPKAPKTPATRGVDTDRETQMTVSPSPTKNDLVKKFPTYKLPLFVLLPDPLWSETFFDSYKKAVKPPNQVLKRVLPTVDVTIDANGNVTVPKTKKPVGAVNAGLLSYADENLGGHIVYYEVDNDNVYVYDPNGRTAIVDGNIAMDIDITMNVMVPDLDAHHKIISALKATQPAKEKKRRLLKVMDWDMASLEPTTETQEPIIQDNEPLEIFKAIAEYNEFVIECDLALSKEVTKRCMPAIRSAVRIQSDDTVPRMYEPKMSASYTELSLEDFDEDSDGVSDQKTFFRPTSRQPLKNARLSDINSINDIQKRLTFRLGLTISPKPAPADVPKDEFALTLNTYMNAKRDEIIERVSTFQDVVYVDVHTPCIVRNKEDPLLTAIDRVFVGKQIKFQPVPALNFGIGKDSKIVQLMETMFPNISTNLFTMPGVCATIAMHYMCTFVENGGKQVSENDRLLYETNYLHVPRDASDVFVLLKLMESFYSRVTKMDQNAPFVTMCRELVETTDEQLVSFADMRETAPETSKMLITLTQKVAAGNVDTQFSVHSNQVRSLVETLTTEQEPLVLTLNDDKLSDAENVVYVTGIPLNDERRTSIAYYATSTDIPFCD
jgi:hypothetical protein